MTAADRPVIKQPVWTPEIPFYLYTGGLAGASAALAAAAELRGNRVLARRAWAAALAGGIASPVLLISDLGKPARFLHMLRMVKVTSPMSMGSWILSAFGPATAVAAADAWAGPLPVVLAAPAKVASAALGLPLATYTAALLADTAIPVWHEARETLPVVFASGAAMSAGAAALALTPESHAGPARRLAVGGAVVELAAVSLMERRLAPPVGSAYERGPARALGLLAKGLTACGGVAALRSRHSRGMALAGGALLTAGAVLERWSVFRAGFQSAADPRATVVPQSAARDSSPRASRQVQAI